MVGKRGRSASCHGNHGAQAPEVESGIDGRENLVKSRIRRIEARP
jgi:hypothetical protein